MVNRKKITVSDSGGRAQYQAGVALQMIVLGMTSPSMMKRHPPRPLRFDF
jgi:hypothetical protein